MLAGIVGPDLADPDRAGADRARRSWRPTCYNGNWTRRLAVTRPGTRAARHLAARGRVDIVREALQGISA